MQELLQKRPNANLVVHAIWFEALPVVDKREDWPADLRADPRAIHHWDEGRVVASFFGADPSLRGKGLIGWRGVMWDTYLLFGRDARWTDRPAGPCRGRLHHHCSEPADGEGVGCCVARGLVEQRHQRSASSSAVAASVFSSRYLTITGA